MAKQVKLRDVLFGVAGTCILLAFLVTGSFVRIDPDPDFRRTLMFSLMAYFTISLVLSAGIGLLLKNVYIAGSLFLASLILPIGVNIAWLISH